MPKVYIIGGLVVVLLIGGFFVLQGTIGSSESESSTVGDGIPSDQSVSPDTSPASTQRGEQDGEESAKNIVAYTGSGYSPKDIVIKAGETVTFKNESSRGIWPASAIHPTHTVYPGSGITKCGSGANIFDACRILNPGEEWSFVFENAGDWKYHDHTRPSHRGSIIVE